MIDPRRPIAPEDAFAERVRVLEARIDELERPSGTQAYSAVTKLQALVENIQTQLDAWVATRWTNDEIDARVASMIQTTLADDVTIGGALLVEGSVRLPGARETSVATATERVAAWMDGEGTLGHTAS